MSSIGPDLANWDILITICDSQIAGKNKDSYDVRIDHNYDVVTLLSLFCFHIVSVCVCVYVRLQILNALT